MLEKHVGKITAEEADHILREWVTKGVRVEAFLSNPCNVKASVSGSIEFDREGNLCVLAGDDALAPFMRFDPAVAIHRNYGDASVAMAGSLVDLGGPRLASVLFFTLADGTLVFLYEIAA